MNACLFVLATLVAANGEQQLYASYSEPLPLAALPIASDHHSCAADCTAPRGGCCGCGLDYYWLKPCYGPGNMPQHVPYMALPKTYYYFRPYNHQHVRLQQQQAVQWNADPRTPYSNAIFQVIYDQVEQEMRDQPFQPDDGPSF